MRNSATGAKPAPQISCEEVLLNFQPASDAQSLPRQVGDASHDADAAGVVCGGEWAGGREFRFRAPPSPPPPPPGLGVGAEDAVEAPLVEGARRPRPGRPPRREAAGWPAGARDEGSRAAFVDATSCTPAQGAPPLPTPRHRPTAAAANACTYSSTPPPPHSAPARELPENEDEELEEVLRVAFRAKGLSVKRALQSDSIFSRRQWLTANADLSELLSRVRPELAKRKARMRQAAFEAGNDRWQTVSSVRRSQPFSRGASVEFATGT
ncbi:Protein of unknown function [Gryllus bimaculatus]|nr:Protein of unknown function [Gryllus bimaculatus]